MSEPQSLRCAPGHPGPAGCHLRLTGPRAVRAHIASSRDDTPKARPSRPDRGESRASPLHSGQPAKRAAHVDPWPPGPSARRPSAQPRPRPSPALALAPPWPRAGLVQGSAHARVHHSPVSRCANTSKFRAARKHFFGRKKNTWDAYFIYIGIKVYILQAADEKPICLYIQNDGTSVGHGRPCSPRPGSSSRELGSGWRGLRPCWRGLRPR